jgi:hypothetical protein
MKSPPPWVRGLLVEDSGKVELVRERQRDGKVPKVPTSWRVFK